MKFAGFVLYRSPRTPQMLTHWGDSWLYGGLVCFAGWVLSFPGWPPAIQREERRARAALRSEIGR